MKILAQYWTFVTLFLCLQLWVRMEYEYDNVWRQEFFSIRQSVNFSVRFSGKNGLPCGKAETRSFPGLPRTSGYLYLMKNCSKSTEGSQNDLENNFFHALKKRLITTARSSPIHRLNYSHFFLLEAQLNELKDCQISYPALDLDKNGDMEREVRCKSHIDVICNIISGGQIWGNLASANST